MEMYQNEMFGKQANSLDKKAAFMIEILIMDRHLRMLWKLQLLQLRHHPLILDHAESSYCESKYLT